MKCPIGASEWSSEYLARVAQLASGWIVSADEKAATLMAIAGIVLGLFFAASPAELAPTGSRALQWLFVGMTSLTIVAASVALWPRTNRREMLKGHGTGKAPRVLSRSPSYYGDVAAGSSSSSNSPTSRRKSSLLMTKRSSHMCCV